MSCLKNLSKKGQCKMKENNNKSDKIAEMRVQALHFMAVINAPNEKSTQEQLQFLNANLLQINNTTNYPFIASIIHDKDIEINGELKTLHAHIFIDTPLNPTKRQLLNDLSKELNIDKDLISLTPTKSDFLLVQYLIHKNDKLKTQYNRENIITNDSEELEKRLNKIYRKPLNEEELQNEIFISNTFTDLIKKIGLENAKKYQSCFKQVKQEQQQDYDGLLKLITRLKYNLEHIQKLLDIHFNALNQALTDNEKEYLKLDTLKAELEDIFAKFI